MGKMWEKIKQQTKKLSSFYSGGKSGWQKRTMERKEEEEKTTATELCRGFNQPNYSLITETRNLEQLTQTQTHIHTHVHG